MRRSRSKILHFLFLIFNFREAHCVPPTRAEQNWDGQKGEILIENFEKEERIKNGVQCDGDEKSLDHDFAGRMSARGIFFREEMVESDVQWSAKHFAEIAEEIRERFFVFRGRNNFLFDECRGVKIAESPGKNDVREHRPERAEKINIPKTRRVGGGEKIKNVFRERKSERNQNRELETVLPFVESRAIQFDTENEREYFRTLLEHRENDEQNER